MKKHAHTKLTIPDPPYNAYTVKGFHSFEKQFSSVQSLDQFDCKGDLKDDLADILSQSFLWKANWEHLTFI